MRGAPIRNSKRVPESWTGGPNRWSREKLRTYQGWMLNPKGTDMHQDAGKRSKPVSMGEGGSTVDELYERMVKRGIVAKEGA